MNMLSSGIRRHHVVLVRVDHLCLRGEGVGGDMLLRNVRSYNIYTAHHFPEDAILHCYLLENIKSYRYYTMSDLKFPRR
jgi:hypothetical protein